MIEAKCKICEKDLELAEGDTYAKRGDEDLKLDGKPIPHEPGVCIAYRLGDINQTLGYIHNIDQELP